MRVSTIKRVMREMGSKGGTTTAERLTPEQRIASATKASKAAAAARTKRAAEGSK